MELNFLPMTHNQEITLTTLARGEQPAWLTGQLVAPLRKFKLVNDDRTLTQLGRAVADVVRNHRMIAGRKKLGRGPIKGSGMTYGTTAGCTCGEWKSSVNQAASRGGTKIMKAQHALHMAEHVTAELAEPYYGFATVSFVNTRTAETHDVTLPFTFAVDVDNLDSSELAWEAAEVWPTAGWDQDVTVWAVNNVTVTVDGTVTEITPSR